MILIFLMEKIKIKIKFIGGDLQDQDQLYKFTGSDKDHQKDHDLDLFHQDQLILNNPAGKHLFLIFPSDDVWAEGLDPSVRGHDRPTILHPRPPSASGIDFLLCLFGAP